MDPEASGQKSEEFIDKMLASQRGENRSTTPPQSLKFIDDPLVAPAFQPFMKSRHGHVLLIGKDVDAPELKIVKRVARFPFHGLSAKLEGQAKVASFLGNTECQARKDHSCLFAWRNLLEMEECEESVLPVQGFLPLIEMICGVGIAHLLAPEDWDDG
jgi:hypothetical protein